MLTGEYKSLYQSLSGVIDTKRMYHDTLHTLAFGTDASFYRLIPKLVIKAKNVDEVIAIMQETSRRNIAVTYRAGGTSLSGQAISDSVLVIAGEHWKGYEILDGGERIRLQPGIVGSRANTVLASYGRKIGPDPASINAAMIGGIAANNASGMCCGTSENSYKTVDSMKIVFRDGCLLDTGDEASRKQFLQSHAQLIDDVNNLVEAVNANEPLTQRIKDKFKMKNTTGYSLNAFVDFKDPFEVIEHIMIGSEGTLGFIAEITYKTVVEHAHKASSLMIFPHIEKACIAVSMLKNTPVAAVELIDRAGLRSVEDQDGVPSYLKTLSKDASAILVETRASDKDSLTAQIDIILDTIKEIPSELPLTFTSIPAQFNALWKIRKGLFPSVGAIRKTGTTVIIEDVTFPVPQLASATLDLQALFRKYDYSEAVIFGHALEGNLHFVFTQDMGDPMEVKRYDAFMQDLVNLVVDKYDGALKAEHGTGRNMAPFVEKEWGSEAYELMKKIKAIFDPGYLLNPGVILNNDPESHLNNLKPLPPAFEKVDKCIECGFCEPTCVANELTLSPRQRIATYREISRLKASGEKPHEAAALVNAFQYAGDETCATDGLCALSCPVNIDTGKLIKELRFNKHTPKQNKIATWLAQHMDLVTRILRKVLCMLNVVHTILGSRTMSAISKCMYKFSGKKIPLWNKYMPKASKKIYIPEINPDNPRKVVYFPSCINRSMGPSKDQSKEQLTSVFERLILKAGYEIIYPFKMNSLCCGMSYSSKGFKEQGLMKSQELEEALQQASINGKYPVVCDMSPCLYTMKENMQDRLKLYEPVEFILKYLKDYLEFEPIDKTVSVFAVCSMKKMGMDAKLVELAEMCATKVVKPDTNCCGFAGDRGFSYPELNKHGLRNLKIQLPHEVQKGYSTSRTCEIGLSKNSGVSHESIVYLVDKVTKPLQSYASKVLITIAALVISCLGMNPLKAQDKPTVKLSGFVSSEAIFDSRKVVSARDGDVILYPAPKSIDDNGVDINEKGDFSFLSIHSRLRAKAGGVNLWGGKLSGLIEFDFVGSTNAYIGLVRMRHAMVQLDYSKTSILFGQYWHPMFVTGCFPAISSWGASAPISVLARNPQIRISHQLSDKFRASVAAVSQFDFKSSGPDGVSNVYLRQSSMPELDVHFEYGSKGKSLIGFVAGTKKIVPRQLNSLGNYVDESIRSYHALAYTTLKFKPVHVKLQAIYAENGSDMLLLGGYGVSHIDSPTEKYTYTPLSTLNYWGEIVTQGSKVKFGLFAGWAKQLGSKDTIADGNAVFARGSNLDYVARIAPRIILGNKAVKVMFELNQTFAAYGVADEKYKISNAETVGNTRLQLHVMYSF